MTKAIAIDDIDLNDERVAFVEAKPSGWAGTVSVEDFHKALDAVGVPEEKWPKEPTGNKCLERAVNGQKSDRRTLVRPLPKGKGWSLVYEYETQLDLDNRMIETDHTGHDVSLPSHKVGMTCRVKKVNDVEYVEITPWDHPSASAVKQSFTEWQGTFKCSQDLSIWFSQTVVPWCNGVATRARGGSYYILKGDALNRMRKVDRALERVSHCYSTPLEVGGTTINLTRVEQGGRIILKPEVASAAAVEILIDNFVSECDKVCDTVTKGIEKKGVGHKALDTQQSIATAQVTKLKLFEEVLDTKLDELRDRLIETESSAGIAALQALAD
jgi:hypothetical protein